VHGIYTWLHGFTTGALFIAARLPVRFIAARLGWGTSTVMTSATAIAMTNGYSPVLSQHGHDPVFSQHGSAPIQCSASTFGCVALVISAQ